MKYALLGSLMACVLLAGLCGAAAAAEKKFNHFSIDLPAKCSATEKESIVTVSCGQDYLFHWYFYKGGNRQYDAQAVCRKAVGQA